MACHLFCVVARPYVNAVCWLAKSSAITFTDSPSALGCYRSLLYFQPWAYHDCWHFECCNQPESQYIVILQIGICFSYTFHSCIFKYFLFILKPPQQGVPQIKCKRPPMKSVAVQKETCSSGPDSRSKIVLLVDACQQTGELFYSYKCSCMKMWR